MHELPQTFLTILHYLVPGLGITVSVTLIALAIGFFIGTLMAVMRIYGGPFLRPLAAAYSMAVRAVPVVVIIFILYFVIAELVDLSPFLSGAIALGVASGAYQSEIFRGAILSVPPGQMIAARAIGMGRFTAIRSIILPQAIRIAIPAWVNEFTLVLKDSTLVYVIGVPELLRRAQWVSARTLEPFLAFGTAAAFYLVFTLVASRLLGSLERRYKIIQ
ncbi:amino acid ABC transporter permease [Desulfosarcina ovata]|uniref:Amino acid ABC transporter permease n=2 Tax=Desulfosarcina ovata TaxID=83564 RepID=A0A5K8AK51_9BACT|nr:amino acid ABC transporter permease [Desulfosarcina ovata]BBO85288.1 amino acid ABC transporter permease [Desulfosarcina ovata subsp. sediminis]BBO92180.1 amino acid ABC transporter permease [Desulfosarcina ovata subsp. ovata]